MSKLRSRREFLRLSAMASAGAVLSACVPAPTPQVVEKVVTKEVEKEVVVTATPEVKEPVKLIAWFADRRTINIMTQEIMKSQFEVRYPHISVEVQFVPEGEIPAKMATAYAAGQAPDISALDETQLPGFLQQGFVHPIPEDIINVTEEMGTRMGEFYKIEPGPAYYALPNGNMPGVMYYNADLLDQLGYKPEDIPSKWDDFIEWAKELTVWEGDEIKQWGFTIVGAPWFWDAMSYQKGGFLFKNSQESMLDDPIHAESWQFVLDLVDKHKLDSRFAPLNPQERVGQGLAATGFNFGFAAGFLVNQYPDVNWGTLPLPTFSGEPPYGRASDDLGFCTTTQKEEPHETEAVWALWRYLVGPEYQARYAVLRGLAPSLVELYQEEQFSLENPQFGGIARVTRPGNFRADGVWPAAATPLMHQEAWERIINVGDPIETVLADHKAQIDEILTEYDLPLLNGKEGWKAEWEEPEA